MGRLANKVAFITGAASGIGSACALRFAQEGASIAGFDISNALDDAWKTAAETAPGSIFDVGDVKDEEKVRSAIDSAAERFGRLDIVVNSAGVPGGGPVHLVPQEEWDRVMDVNLKGTFLVCKHALPRMMERGSGSIVNIASIEGIEGTEGGSMYNASKGGVVLLTKNMSMDYARQGVRVNVVCPGFIDTPMAQAVFGNEFLEGFEKQVVDAVALHRLGRPEEIANAVLFLASDEASFITGQALVVDGGFTVGHRFGITKIMGLEE